MTSNSFRRTMPLLCAAVMLIAGSPLARSATNPFEIFRPCVTLTSADLARLSGGKTVVRTLDGDDGIVGTFGARRISADGERLIAWIREIEQLKRSHLVQSIGRFSDPPAAADVARLSLEPSELQDIGSCKPTDCDLKLTAAEITRLQRAIDKKDPQWKQQLDGEFRRLVLDRVRAYGDGGQKALGKYDDGRSPASLEGAFWSILQRSRWLTAHFPTTADYLQGIPGRSGAGIESFLYWSKESFGGRPVVSATHVVITRRNQDVISLGKQVFATHYMNGSLNLTGVVVSPEGERFLVILNRTNVDLIHGLLGGVTRLAIERRLKSELSGLLDHLARRIEAGPPEPRAAETRFD